MERVSDETIFIWNEFHMERAQLKRILHGKCFNLNEFQLERVSNEILN